MTTLIRSMSHLIASTSNQSLLLGVYYTLNNIYHCIEWHLHNCTCLLHTFYNFFLENFFDIFFYFIFFIFLFFVYLGFAKALLEVGDDFERAIQAVPTDGKAITDPEAVLRTLVEG